jgi:hypothetical protein
MSPGNLIIVYLRALSLVVLSVNRDSLHAVTNTLRNEPVAVIGHSQVMTFPFLSALTLTK